MKDDYSKNQFNRRYKYLKLHYIDMSEKETPWYQNEEIWKDWMSSNLEERAQKEVDKIESLIDIEEGASILDLCCGTGRHSIELAKRGHDVTGVDITEHFLERAEDNAEDEDVELELIEKDMRGHCEPESYDLVLNLADSFGYFEDEEENLQVLENIYESLRSNGRLLMEVTGKEVFAGMFKEKDWRRTDEGYLLHENKVENDWDTFRENRIKITDEDIREYENRFTIYSGKELREMLEEVGFDKVKIYGNMDGDSYDQNASRLIAVARKG